MIDDDLLALGQQQLDNEARMMSSGFDLSAMPQLSTAMPSEAGRHGFMYNALRTGWNEAQGWTDNAVAAGLKLAGADQASADWSRSAAEQDAEAARFRMNDLETAPWREGGSWANLPKQALYQALKQAPNIATMAAGTLAAPFLPEVSATSGLAVGAGRLMGALGGEATAAAGAKAAQKGLGIGLAAYPQAVGSMYGEAVDRGDPSRWDAAKALIMGVPYAGLEAVEAAPFLNIFSKLAGPAAEKGLAAGVRGALADGAKAVVNEAAVEGAQTVMEQSFRPDLTLGQKANNVVDAMFMGGLAGGALGGAFSGAGRALRAINTAPANAVSQNPDAMTATIDSTLNGQQTAGQPADMSANPQTADMPPPDMSPNPQNVDTSAAPVEEPDMSARPFDPARPYGVFNEEQLAQRISELPPDAPQLAAIKQEIDLRRQEREAVEQARQVSADEQAEAARQKQVQDYALQLREEVGLGRQSMRVIARLGATDAASAFDAISAALAAGDKTKSMRQLGEHFGINPDGTPRDIASELATMQDVLAGAPNAQTRKQVEDHIARLQGMQAIQGQVAQRRQDAAQAAQEQEAARAADAQAQIARAQAIELTSRPLAELVQEQMASMSSARRTQFQRGVIAFASGEEAPTRADARAGYALAQRYSEAQNLVETFNGQAPNAARQPAENGGLDAGPGNAPGAALNTVEGVPVEGQTPGSEGQGAVGLRVEGAPAEGAREEGTPGVPEGSLTPTAASDAAARAAAAEFVSKSRAERLEEELARLEPGKRGAFKNGVRSFVARAPLPASASAAAREGYAWAEKYAEAEKLASAPASIASVRSPADAPVTPPAEPPVTVAYNPDTKRITLGAYALDVGAPDAAALLMPAKADFTRDSVNYYDRDQRAHYGRPGEAYVQDMSSEGIEGFMRPYIEAYLKGTMTPEQIVADVRRQLDPTAAPAAPQNTNAAPGSRPSAPAQQAAATSAPASAPAAPAPRSAPEEAQAVGEQIREAEQVVAAAETGARKTSGWREKFVKAHLPVVTMFHIAKFYQRQMPGLMKFVEAQQTRQNIAQRVASVGMQGIYKLEAIAKDAQKMVGLAMMEMTELGLDPEKAWADHTHITKSRTMSDARKELLRQKHAGLVRLWRSMQGNGAAAVVREFRAMNKAEQLARHAVAMQRMLQVTEGVPPGIKNSVKNPMERFLRQANGNDSAAAALDFWQKESNRVLGLADTWVQSELKALERQHLKPEEFNAQKAQLPSRMTAQLLSRMRKQQKQAEQEPYFHLPRFGDYSVSFRFQTEEDGSVDERTMQHIADALRDYGARVNPATDKSRAYVRLDSAAKRDELMDKLVKMAEDGWVEKGSILQDVRIEDNPLIDASDKKLLKSLLTELDASHIWDDENPDHKVQKAKTERFIREFMLDMQPDISIDKVLAPRQNIPGYDMNLLRGYAHRLEVGGQALARMAGSAQVMDAMSDMRRQLQGAKSDPNADVTLLANLYNEALKREFQRSVGPGKSIYEVLRTLDYTYYMGLNPSHAALQFMQIPTLLLPQLAKRANVGFMKASKAIGRATTEAFKIMSAVIGQGMDLGIARAASAVITPQALEKAFPGAENAAQREFLMRVVNSGAIDTGSETREMGRKATETGGKFDIFLQYANALGFYAETTSRLVAALASRDLNLAAKMGEEDIFHAAIEDIDEAMFNFANYNVARMMGKNGFLGPATPLVTQFMSYNAQLTEKLYRETYKAIGAGLTNDAEKKEARMFLLYHAGAVMAVAGAMGLPFATAFAVAFDKLKDWLDPEDKPFDSRAAFRNWMNIVFGQTVGDVVARGLPRLTGTDLTDRAGEANLMPLSQFAADRASWRDAFGHLEQRGFGAPASAVANIFGAVDQFHAGKYFEATRAFMPQGVKNMMDTYRMEEKGYVDAKGHPLPLSVSALDELRKAIGFKGAREADYAEVKQINDREKKRLAQDSGPIMTNLIDALVSGDQDSARDYFAQAQAFDAQHPRQAILPKLQSRLQATLRGRAIEQATGMPAGIDLANTHLQDSLQWYQGRER